MKEQWGDDRRRNEMSDRFRRLWQDPEYRQRMTEARQKVWADPDRKAAASERGKLRKHTDEERRKISEGQKGKVIPPEARAKMSAAKKGKPASESTKEALRRGARKPRSDETKLRMGSARKKYWADPENRKALGVRTRKFWASLTTEEKTRLTRPGRLACLEATRLREPTSIERSVACILTELGITFEQQVLFKYYAADIYLPEQNVIIECDGDYWHSTPVMIAHDKKRDKWFANHGIGVIRLKECDIKANARQCVEQALKDLK